MTFPDNRLVCPLTGRTIAKSLRENLQVRRYLLAAAQGNPEVQQALLTLCRQSFSFWCNYFVWTFSPYTTTDDGRVIPSAQPHQPFILWPVQEAHAATLLDCISRSSDVLFDKSRDEGATVLNLTVQDWFWLFHADRHIALVSQNEDAVDKTGDERALMYKLDYLHRNLPSWMLPCAAVDLEKGGRYRQHLQITNPITHSTFTGRAATATFSKGARAFITFFDEMAIMLRAKDAWEAAADAHGTRIANSTPAGAGTFFTALRNRALRDGNPTLLVLGYWDDPRKGQGRVWAQDADGSITGTAGRWYWDCPWLRATLPKRTDKQDIGANIFIDHTTSGTTFFRGPLVSQQLARAITPTRAFLSSDGARFEPSPIGNWYLFSPLGSDGRLISPPANRVAFADISHGIGASNTVLAVLNLTTRQIEAEMVDPSMTLPELAEEMAASGNGVFAAYGRPMFIGWEVNGAESLYLELVERLRYRRVYYRRRLGRRKGSRTREYGWLSTRREKRILLGGLDGALADGSLHIPSQAGLLEMLEYVWYDDGSVGPGHLRDEVSGAREAHGDRVIAYAGCVFMAKEVAAFEAEAPKPRYAPGTLGHLARLDELDQEIDVWQAAAKRGIRLG